MNPIQQLTSLGQSLWYDNVQRRLLENGELKALIERGDIRGVTSNPTIFNNAIAKTNDYDSALMPLAWAGWDAEKIFWQLAIDDIQEACDLFAPLYRETNGGDGYVSLEVSPYLAHDATATAAQALELWERVARPNLMIKIPATREGIPAVRTVIGAGVNVNVTLIFSLTRYADVMDAYLCGLEDRLALRKPIQSIASVASFFISRVDSKVDPQLPADSPLRGKAAIANAKLAYQLFTQTFAGARWDKLKAQGARLQRPLWASTSTKNPAYPDTIYVDNLIGADTVNTVPPATLDAFRDHGVAEETLTREVEFDSFGVSMDVVTQELEEEGVKAFADAFTQLISTIDERRSASSLGFIADSVSKRLIQFEADSVFARFWALDPTLWDSAPEGQAEATKRLGWLDSPEKARALIPVYESFAKEIQREGIDRVLVLGMGGSSLTAEVLSSLVNCSPHFQRKWGEMEGGGLSLAILDSTDPVQVSRAARDFPPAKSLYIVASKSGGTAEVNATFDYFWELSRGDGSRFIAVTDPKTSLEALARERGFRKIFSSDETVGGRFSALTDFGMIPAALLGMDLSRYLDRADAMKRQALKETECNPAFMLGIVLAESALAGRDKLTIVCDAPVSALAGWIEQIVAESSGKHGKGILPVPLEPLGAPEAYGNDHLFIYLRQNGEHDKGISALKRAGFPVIAFSIESPYDAAAEFYRWEIATCIACCVLGVNPFDQPDVQDSKARTKAKIAEFQKTGKLPDSGFITLKAKAALNDFLSQAKAGDYIAVNAYLPRDDQTIAALQKLRLSLRDKTKCAVTTGFGPRFQHSTGQFHKGGPDTGLFLQITVDPETDMDIPTEGLTFGTLLRAQALGDYETLAARGRKVLRIHLSSVKDVGEIVG